MWRQAVLALLKLVDEFGDGFFVDIMTEICQISGVGIFSTPPYRFISKLVRKRTVMYALELLRAKAPSLQRTSGK
jgi:hypothetical protein